MAKVSVEALILQQGIKETLKNEDYIVLSFLQKGFQMSNIIRIDEERDEIEFFIKKEDLMEWSNSEQMSLHAISNKVINNVN